MGVILVSIIFHWEIAICISYPRAKKVNYMYHLVILEYINPLSSKALIRCS